MRAHRVLDELLALVAPPSCVGCREALDDPGARLCPACVRALPWLGAGGCPRCGLPSHRTRACPAAGAAFDRAWAPLAYDGVARAVVGALKFGGALGVADLMAAQMAANLPPDLRRPGPSRVVVPVPAHRGRRRRRGFDPAGVLAERFAARTDAAVADCLRRRDRSGEQARTGRAVRRRAGRLAIEATGAVSADAMLVDDVHTTGATLDACARALRSAGCERITALTYARTL